MNRHSMNQIDQVRQKKIDSLAAKHLHQKSLHKLNERNQRIDFIALAVPLLYFVIRFLVKGTKNAEWAEPLWEFLAASLLVLTFAKINFKWQEKAQEHSKLMGENISVVGLADSLLTDAESIGQNFRLFSLLAEKSEKDDRILLGQPSDAERCAAYREALKEFAGAAATCPICKASPWKFQPGSCQACGNRPEGS